jgi:hypothetical protein
LVGVQIKLFPVKEQTPPQHGVPGEAHVSWQGNVGLLVGSFVGFEGDFVGLLDTPGLVVVGLLG